jgi:hypothetical protein
MIFGIRRLGDDAWKVTLGAGQGLLTYWVIEGEHIVVSLDLTVAG